MGAYILVLVIGGAGATNSAPAMTSIPGFPTRALCLSAGTAWLAESKKEYQARFYCVDAPRV